MKIPRLQWRHPAILMHLQDAPQIFKQVLVKQLSHMVIVFIYQAMNVGQFLSHPQMPYYSSILPSVFVDEAPRVLIAETKSNQSQDREATLLEVLHYCLVYRYRWEDRRLRLKTSTLKLCHIICQLGSTLNNVDGLKAMF